AVIEVNEAFASVVLQFVQDTGLGDRMEDVNPNGGGISLGHPLGATGARITATLVAELDRREAHYGIATMCIGQGQAIAAVIERLRSRAGCSFEAGAGVRSAGMSTRGRSARTGRRGDRRSSPASRRSSTRRSGRRSSVWSRSPASPSTMRTRLGGPGAF